MTNEQTTKMLWVVGAISKELNIEPSCIAVEPFIFIIFDVGETSDCIRYDVEHNKLWCTGDYDVVTVTQRRILAGIAYDNGLEIDDE